MFKKFSLALTLAVTLAISSLHVGVLAADAPAAPSVFPKADVVILHTNDTHGYVKANDASKVIGFDTIAAIKAEAGSNALLLDAGDFTNGQPFAAKTKGVSVVKVMNAAGYNAAVIGNHEYDFADNISSIINTAEFPILSANIHKADGSLVATPSATFDVNGIKVGVIGLTTPETTFKANPLNTAGFTFGNLDAIKKDAAEQADKLRADGCKIVIALTHLGIDKASVETSAAIAPALAGKVDAIIDGHSHSAPSLDQVVNGIPIVSTGGESNSNVGWVAFSKDGDKYKVEYGYIDFALAREKYKPIESVTKLIDELNAPVDEMEKVIVATTTADLNGERADNRTKETNFGNTITDAIREFTGADVAFTNGGGIRASIPAGKVSEMQVFTAFPFGNVVYMAEVKGSVIRALLEVGCGKYPEASGGFAQISGMKYKYDPDAKEGSRVVSVTVNGKELDDSATYKLATNDYLAVGGDGYTMLVEPFKTPAAFKPPISSTVMADVLPWYLEKTGGKVSPVEGRVQMLGASGSAFPAQAGSSDVKYIVQNGEQLYTIAYNYYGSMSKETVDMIFLANYDALKGTNGGLTSGVTIILPAKGIRSPITSEAQAASSGAYLVKAGDTLSSIAKANLGDSKLWSKIYDLNKDRITLVNGSPLIYEGQWIAIPK